MAGFFPSPGHTPHVNVPLRPAFRGRVPDLCVAMWKGPQGRLTMGHAFLRHPQLRDSGGERRSSLYLSLPQYPYPGPWATHENPTHGLYNPVFISIPTVTTLIIQTLKAAADSGPVPTPGPLYPSVSVPRFLFLPDRQGICEVICSTDRGDDRIEGRDVYGHVGGPSVCGRPVGCLLSGHSTLTTSLLIKLYDSVRYCILMNFMGPSLAS